MLQVSDSHISCDNESDKIFETFSARMNKAYQLAKHYKTGEFTTSLDNFKEVLQIGKEANADMIALTDDIVNYPSAAAVEFVRSTLALTGIPHMYTAGNHDWHYEGMEGSAESAESLRKEWCEKQLKPLYTGDILCSSKIVGGIKMVMIDNSTYQVNEEQLEFFPEQQGRSEPIVLFVHIPLYIPSMPICCGHPKWGAAVNKNYIVERRAIWPATGNNASTNELIKKVMNSKSLVGIFSGHWHQCRSISSGSVHQHLALPAFNGQYRIIRFQPFS